MVIIQVYYLVEHFQISPIIVEPYNAVLTTHATIENEDVAFVMDNEAMYEILERNLDVPRPTYTNLNRILAQVIMKISCTLNYEYRTMINIDYIIAYI